MKLVVITPTKDVENEQSLVTKMFESGLTTLHLRKPKHSTNQLKEYISHIPKHYHNRIVIHTHYNLALRFNLKGIHLSRLHLSKRWKYIFVKLRLKLKFGRTLKSRSYNYLRQVYEKEDQNFNYYFVGTMFNNITGGLYSGFYEDGVIAANKNSGKKLIAKGGTTLRSIEKVAKYGFKGIAFNSFIWESNTPYETFLDVLEEFKHHNLELE